MSTFRCTALAPAARALSGTPWTPDHSQSARGLNMLLAFAIICRAACIRAPQVPSECHRHVLAPWSGSLVRMAGVLSASRILEFFSLTRRRGSSPRPCALELRCGGEWKSRSTGASSWKGQLHRRGVSRSRVSLVVVVRAARMARCYNRNVQPCLRT